MTQRSARDDWTAVGNGTHGDLIDEHWTTRDWTRGDRSDVRQSLPRVPHRPHAELMESRVDRESTCTSTLNATTSLEGIGFLSGHNLTVNVITVRSLFVKHPDSCDSLHVVQHIVTDTNSMT